MANRVHIREHAPDDLDAYIDWQTDDEVARHLSWLPRSQAGAEACLRDAIAQQKAEARKRFYFAIVITSTDEIIGDVGLTVAGPHQGDCGWFLRKTFQGQGYATEAVKLLVEYAFHNLELQVLTASCVRANSASIGIMKKSGFALVSESEDRLWYEQHKSP